MVLFLGIPRFKLIFTGLIIAAACFLVVAYCNRLYLSVEVTDEADYQSFAYRILAGNTPYAQCWEPHAGGNLLAVPFLALYKSIATRFTGSVLFMRYSYFFATCLISSLVFLCLRGRIGNKAFFAVFPMIFCVFHSVPYFSYNSLSVWLSTLGYAVLFYSLHAEKKLLPSFLGGVLFAASALVYPPLIVLCAVNLAIIYCMPVERPQAFRIAAFYALGGFFAVAAAAIVIFIWSGAHETITGIQGIINSPYRQTQDSIGYSFIGKVFFNRFKDYMKSGIFLVTACLCAGIAAISAFCRSNRLAFVALPIYLSLSMIPFIWICKAAPTNFMYFYIYLFIASIILSFFITDKRERAVVWLFFNTPSILLVLVRSFTSNNHNVFVQIPYILPCIAGIVYTLFVLTADDKASGYASRVFSICLCAMLLFTYNTYVYRDSPINMLTSRVNYGMFRGLYTTESRKTGAERVQKEIESVSQPGKTVMVLNRFAPGYEMSKMIPFTPASVEPMQMGHGYKSIAPLIKYFDAFDDIPDMVLVVFTKGHPFSFSDPSFEINAFLSEHYSLIFQSEPGALYPLYAFTRKGNQ